MENSTRTLTATRAYSAFRAFPRYGPYLLLQILPWLLLATVLRTYMKSAPGALLFLIMPSVQITVFIAFLIASEKMIRLAGGWTSLSKLTIKEEMRFAWQVVWRLLLLFLATVTVAVWAGIDKFAAAQIWLGFDGIAFPWRQGVLQVWIAFISILAFLFVVEKGLDRKPQFICIFRQLVAHARHLLLAWFYISVFFVAATLAQSKSAGLVASTLDNIENGHARYILYICFIVVFSHIRVWVAVAILTYALRSSHRRAS